MNYVITIEDEETQKMEFEALEQDVREITFSNNFFFSFPPFPFRPTDPSSHKTTHKEIFPIPISPDCFRENM